MVKIIDKLILELKNNLIDDRKLLTIGKEDSRDKERIIYYISNFKGNRLTKKQRITKADYLILKSKYKFTQSF